MRRSKFSRKANQASNAVNTPSAFSSSDAPEAGKRVEPLHQHDRADHAARQDRACQPHALPPRQLGPAARRRSVRSNARPTPEPR